MKPTRLRQIVFVAASIARGGGIAIVPAIALYAAARNETPRMIGREKSR